MNAFLALPSEITIYTAAELRGAWVAALDALPVTDDADEGADCAICAADGSAVDTVDGCGVQLLASLAGALAARRRTLRVTAASEALASACASLGLVDLIASHASTGVSS